jgi:hypothetical protein
MSRLVETATLDALDAGAIIDRGAVLLELGSGAYGFWTGAGIRVHGGVNYVGAGSLIQIDGIRQTAGLESVPVVGRLTAIANSDLTPDVLANIENEIYHQHPVSVSTWYFATNGVFLSEFLEYRGYIDRIVHTESVNGDSVLEFHCESRFRDHQRSGYRVRSDNDQKRINQFDNGLQHVAKVATERVLFGRSATPPVQPQTKKQKFLGIF